jgi:hypothetical protein
MRLCALTRNGTENDLLLLRNLQDSFLPDLIPDLQQAMRDSIDLRSASGPLGEGDFRALRDAVAEPTHWWSAPFTHWLQTAAATANTDGVRFLVELAGSPEVLEIAIQSLPTTSQVETQILEKLPTTLRRPLPTILR